MIIASGCDWLEYTLPGTPAKRRDDAFAALPWAYDKFTTDAAAARNGYPYGARDRFGAVVHWGASDVMGAHCTIGGGALKASGLRADTVEWRNLLAGINQFGGHLTRIDWAIDYDDDCIAPERLDAALRTGSATTVFRAPRQVYRTEHAGRAPHTTVYLGGTRSDLRVRVYDKRGQMLDTASSEPAELPPRWYRFEAQWRGKAARSMLAELAAPASSARGACTARMRDLVSWPAMPAWARLAAGASASARIQPDDRPREYVRLRAWLTNQVARALYIVAEVEGGTDAVVADMLASGMRRATLDDRAVICRGTDLRIVAGSGTMQVRSDPPGAAIPDTSPGGRLPVSAPERESM